MTITVRPAHEQRALDALEGAITDLRDIRQALLEAFARDDMPFLGKGTDPVHNRTQTATADVLAIAQACRKAKHVAQAASKNTKDEKAGGICSICNEVAARITRGLCPECHGNWTAQGQPDIERFRAWWKQSTARVQA